MKNKFQFNISFKIFCLLFLLNFSNFSFADKGVSFSPDLVMRDGLFYEKFENSPYTGSVMVFYRKGEDKKETDSYAAKGHIEYGKRIGTWTIYYENGQLKKRNEWEKGIKNGEEVEYDLLGNRKVIRIYENGFKRRNSS